MKNTFHFRPGFYVPMEKNDSALYQEEYIGSVQKIARSFDITIGSEKRTDLSWQGNLLSHCLFLT